MQKTNFRFEAIVHDDASTDGTAAIIREYAEKYPDIIKPIFETENQENEERSIWKTYGFSQIPIDAQTGELKIITTGDEKTFSVPKMMTWAELAKKADGVFERR